ncbi:hypothetical protein E2320_018459 [Naja naja]|nr:hypothetical protein E2320_018459 [Naja naja]
MLLRGTVCTIGSQSQDEDSFHQTLNSESAPVVPSQKVTSEYILLPLTVPLASSDTVCLTGEKRIKGKIQINVQSHKKYRRASGFKKLEVFQPL